MPRGSRSKLAIIVGLLGVAGLALGLWDALVERDGGSDTLWDIILPLAVIVLAVYLARGDRSEPPPD